MMDPQEEMHMARSVIALSYLTFNVRTAVLNFWGLVNTWVYLNRELGYAKGTGTFARSAAESFKTQGIEWKDEALELLHGAQADAFMSITDEKWEIDENGKPTELRLALEQAKAENVLDQSYAYYLAGQASNGDLARLAARSVAGKGFKAVVDIGMIPFRGTELLIRRATFLSVYRALQRTRPEWHPKQRYEKAVEMVFNLQGDYTKGNRPMLMRGKLKSLIFIFMTYVHNAAWASYGGIDRGLKKQESIEGRLSPAWYRSYSFQMIILLLAIAGLEGLPFAENVLDIVDYFWKKYVRPGESFRVTMQKQLEEWELDPMRVMRGLTFDLAGLDLSRSIGLGRIVPGTDRLTDEYSTAQDFVGAMLPSLAGVAGGYGLWTVETFMRTWASAGEFGLEGATNTAAKQLARMPGGIGNIAKAIEWSAIDARGPAGGLLAWEDGRPREITSYEIFMKGLGFQPAAVSRHQIIKGAQNDAKKYWQARKRLVLDNYFTALHVEKDREALADAKKAVARFNMEAPAPLRITPKTIKQSMDRRLEAMQAEQELTPRETSFQQPLQEVLEAYE
jgi:hypothetical protein